MYWYLKVLGKYAVFSGRARRKEYWIFTLFNILFTLLLRIIDVVTGSFNPESDMGILGSIYAVAVVIPAIAVFVRRLHDTNRSGWWILISLIPIIGGLILLVFTFQDSTPGTNHYGPNPKETSL